MRWLEQSGYATHEQLGELETTYGFNFSPEHRNFLTNISNGRRAVGLVPVPTLNCPGGAGALDGVYGVNREEEYYDNGTYLDMASFLLPSLVPFAYDEMNGQIFIDMAQKPGQLVYIPLWEIRNSPLRPYHVAASIEEFEYQSAMLAAEYLLKGDL